MTMPQRRKAQSVCGLMALGVACAAVGAFPARAQETPAPKWEFSLTPYLWIAGVSGTLETRNARVPAQNVSADFGDVLSHLNSIPVMGSAEVRYGRFGLSADLMAISVKSDISTRNVLFTGGSARLTQVIGSAVGSYRVVAGADQSLDLGIGVRAIGLSSKFTVNPGLLPGFERSPGVSWANAIAAVRYHIDLAPDWGVTLYGDVGGGPSSAFTWQVFGTVDYRLSDSTSLRAGYRHLHFAYTGEVLKQSIALSGPILGATIRF
ncbi:MAG: hypothetical protein AB7F35_18145 [Acetobacteraceae bacterium]